MGPELPSLRLLFRDPKSTFLILELQSVSILSLLSMATQTQQCHLCLTYPPVVLVRGLLRADHLNQWLIAEPGLSHPLHFLFSIFYISYFPASTFPIFHPLHLLDEILLRTAGSFLALVLELINQTWIQLLKPSPKMPFN